MVVAVLGLVLGRGCGVQKPDLRQTEQSSEMEKGQGLGHSCKQTGVGEERGGYRARNMGLFRRHGPEMGWQFQTAPVPCKESPDSGQILGFY